MLNENAIELIQSIVKNNTDKDKIVTEIKLTDNFSECNAIGNTMSIENILFSSSYNTFVCLRDFTDKEADSMREEVGFEEGIYNFRKGDVFTYDDDEEIFIYYCTVNIDEVKEKTNETNETKEPLQTVNIFECCQNVLNNCDNNKEIWEKIKKMIDIYFE